MQFEHQFYSSYHRKIKEQEFLALRQGDMSVLDYERRFHDLSMFASHYVPGEQHRVERLRDGLRQELRQRLIAFKFETTRDLVEAAEALEACMKEGQQGQHGLGKRKDTEYTHNRPPFSKKGKGQYNQFKKVGGTSVASVQTTEVGSTGGQPNLRGNFSRGVSEQRTITYPLCVHCGQRHPGDCSATPGRCYICRGEHMWRDCPHLGRGCYYCGGQGHFRRDCPRRTEITQNQQQAQSQQQSATVNRPARQVLSGASGSRSRTHVQGDRIRGGRTQGRVYYMT
jgi:hypothetical protein